MWKTFHQLALPPGLYRLCSYCLPWLAAAGVLLLVTGLGWGLAFAPADYQQGDGYRIIYLHVPSAMGSMGIYAAMAGAAFIGLVWQLKMANLAVAAMAPVGAVCTFIALVTGAAWGETDVGRVVGVGCPAHLRTGAAVSLYGGDCALVGD